MFLVFLGAGAKLFKFEHILPYEVFYAYSTFFPT
jgi:hypothetical protein